VVTVHDAEPGTSVIRDADEIASTPSDLAIARARRAQHHDVAGVAGPIEERSAALK
jgi:hypothetical protein